MRSRARSPVRSLIYSLLVFVASAGCGSSAPEVDGFSGPLPGAPTGSPVISSDALVAAYDMSTDSGHLRDLGPHALHGTLLRSQSEPSPHGVARVFTEVGDRIDLPESDAFDLDGPLTIATWVRVDSLGLHQHIAACDDKWALWITPDDQFRLGDTRGGGWSTDPGRVVEGQWTAVVAVLSGTRGDALTEETVSLWVDGEEASSYAHLRSDVAREAGSWGPGELYPDDACSIGFESHQGNVAHQDMPFVGALDDLIISARPWTPEEVRAFSGTSN